MMIDEQRDHVDLDDLYLHLHLPHTGFSIWLDENINRLGQIISWCWPLLLVVIVVNVIMRYLFGEGRIEFEEIQWHIYSAGFLIGLSYTYTADDHVRVDILRERLDFVTQAWIEFYGIVILLMPFLLLIIIYSIDFVVYSYQMAEISEAPGGLPNRWIVKSFLTIGFSVLLLSALSRLSRLTAFLFGWPNPLDPVGDLPAPPTLSDLKEHH
jgi:TRAP-type mannitol/chloroaromatic compound transport system permease small subunit